MGHGVSQRVRNTTPHLLDMKLVSLLASATVQLLDLYDVAHKGLTTRSLT